ncbi:antitoxin ParD1/3/4 [Neorhizobium huautlense]|uniref:Antitoxin ParD1/3/4 n=1 Tax=Neorhizobium huautlense TaxID=67774 RepID=A0ABT9PVW8_9HYPH|nr:hypothetical protein [Neorhizobium huautlense]MDP9838248.1 antitoxin ParD1/3/4 [Neorhizobium huautlense]
MRTLTVSLTPHQAEMMQKRLKKAYAEGMASGEGREVRAEVLLAELKAEARIG